MRYTAFEVTNYKGIESLVLPLDRAPRTNVYALVGLNESGKTTVLEALNFFASKLGHDDSPAALGLPGSGGDDLRNAIPINRASDFSGHVGVAATVQLTDEDIAEISAEVLRKKTFQITHLSNEVTIERRVAFAHSALTEDESFWTLKLEGKRGEVAVVDPASDDEAWQATVAAIRRRLPPIWYFPNFLIDFPDRIVLAGPELDFPKNRFYRQLMQDVLGRLGDGLALEAHVRDRLIGDDLTSRRTAEQLLLRLGREITDQIFGAWEAILQRKLGEKRIVISWGSAARGHVHLDFNMEDKDGLFRISERSLGFRWFFAFLLLTHYRSLRRNAARPVFLLDEPASNLHSSAQSELLRSFSRIAETSTIIYSTHSHHLINADWLECAFVVRNAAINYAALDDGSRRSVTSVDVQRYRAFVSKHPDQTTYFQPILDVLDYKPGRIENVPDVAMLEGKGDFYIARFALLLHSDLPAPNLLPGGGAGSLDRAIQLYLAWGRNFIVILDSDAEGCNQKARYEERFGAVVQGRLYTLADIHPEWSTIESLVAQEDQLTLQRQIEPDAIKIRKHSFHLAVQEMVARRATCAVTDQTRQQLRFLLNGIRERLESTEVRRDALPRT